MHLRETHFENAIQDIRRALDFSLAVHLQASPRLMPFVDQSDAFSLSGKHVSMCHTSHTSKTLILQQKQNLCALNQLQTGPD